MCLHSCRGDGSDHSLRSLRMAVSKNGALVVWADVGIGPYENEGGKCPVSLFIPKEAETWRAADGRPYIGVRKDSWIANSLAPTLACLASSDEGAKYHTSA